MPLQAPQQIRLRREANERQIRLLYLPSEASGDSLNPGDHAPKPRKIFRLVGRDGRPAVAAPPTVDASNKHTTEPTRYILTESEPSRKRKFATFTAEFPRKKVNAKSGDEGHASTATDASLPAPFSSTDTTTVTPSRKRPGASTATRRALVETADISQNGGQPSNGAGDSAFKQMLEEAETQTQVVASQTSTAGRHRFLPKATTRLKDRVKSDSQQSADTMDIDGGHAKEYVYDTYILDDAMDFDLQSIEPGSVGLLHIEQEQQPVWETYLDDETDSDEAHNSDDEDSNAEDYYGADYPEDELDSDDERDVNAYRYRRDASDDEEYDLDEPLYSDAEEESHLPGPTRHVR